MAAITQQQVLELFNVIGAISNSDEILMQSAQGNAAVKITAELFRAYLNQDFTITINEQGYWTVGGSSTGVQATPMMRNNNGDLEFSTDRGYTWHLLIPIDDLMPELTPEQIASLKVDLTDLTEEDIALLQAPAREAAADLEAVKTQVNAAKEAANEAAGNANAKAELALQAAGAANQAAQAAQTAEGHAEAVAGLANQYAEAANQAAQAAQAASTIPIIDVEGSSADIYPGRLYRWASASAITVNILGNEAGKMNEYMLQFKVTNANFTLQTVPAVTWAEEPEFELNRTYQVSIVNGLAIYAGWDISG